MCYASPGPRCSTHAVRALKEALEKFEYDQTPETYGKVMSARLDFETTPGGWRSLQTKIDASNSDAEKAEFETRLTEGQARRQEALSAYNALHANNPEVETGVDNDGSPRNRVIVDGRPVDPHKDNYVSISFDNDISDYDPGVTMDTDDYHREDRYGDGCTESYCNDREINIMNWSFNAREYFQSHAFAFYARGRYVYDNKPNLLSEEDLQRLEYLSNDLESEVTYGYYGAESAKLKFPDTTKKEVRAVLEGAVAREGNGFDDTGVWPYLREEGLSVDGRSPLESVDYIVQQNPYTSDRLKAKVAASTKVYNESIAGNKEIKVGRGVMANVPEIYRKRGWNPDILGVLWHDKRTGAYHLVDGHERVLVARRKTGYGRFIVVE